jgi:Zn finger protein HypA/HybF involved in hydrogenase expression
MIKQEICNNCEFKKYQLEPNMFKCDKCEYFINELVISETLTCPEGKW